MTETRAYTLGQTRAGRWWVQCTRRGCDHYRSGLGLEDARSIAERHQAEHDKRRKGI